MTKSALNLVRSAKGRIGGPLAGCYGRARCGSSQVVRRKEATLPQAQPSNCFTACFLRGLGAVIVIFLRGREEMAFTYKGCAAQGCTLAVASPGNLCIKHSLPGLVVRGGDNDYVITAWPKTKVS